MSESLIRIVVGGRFLEVTPEHRFVRYTDRGQEVVPALDLRPGDRLPLHKRTHVPVPREPELDFDDRIVKLTANDRHRIHAAYAGSRRTSEDLAGKAGISRQHLRNGVAPSPCREATRAGVLANLAGELGLEADSLESRPGVRPTVGLYELLGYTVAVGCFTSDRLCIADKDLENLRVYATKFEDALGIVPRIVKGPHRNWELTCHSRPLGRFLRATLETGIARSGERRVPDFAFALPEDKRAGFVRGYFDGEGWVGDHQVAATSASPYLLVGIQALLSSLGVDSQIGRGVSAERGFGTGPYFTLTIGDMSAFARKIGFCAPAKRARLGERREPRFGRTELLPVPLVRGALEALRQRATLHTTRSHQTGHDILRGRVKPNASSLRRIAVAFDAPEIRDRLDRQVVLGEVTSVEHLKEETTVYDFVLEGSPYFVANQVVTHNCDEEFEAFLLEVLSENQVTIPELGTIKAVEPPYVILTSNRIRELSDALRRRCLYLWIDFPGFDKEVRIVMRKVPGANDRLAKEVTRFMETLRTVRLAKVPGVAETLDWAQALVSLHADHLDEELVTETLGCVLKDPDDIKRVRRQLASEGMKRFLALE